MAYRKTVSLNRPNYEFLKEQHNASAIVGEALRVYRELLAYADVLGRMDEQDRKLDEILSILRSGAPLVVEPQSTDGEGSPEAARNLDRMTEKFRRGER